MLGKPGSWGYDVYKQLEKGLKAPGVCFSGIGAMSRPDKPSNKADTNAADSQQSADGAPDSAAVLLAKLTEAAITTKPVKESGREVKEPPPATTIAPYSKFDAVAAARQAIAFHEKTDASRSYLGAALSSLTSADEKSLAQLKKLTADYDQASSAGNRTEADKIKQQLEKAVRDDRKALERQDEIAQYGGGFLKATGLFMRGKVGLWGTAAAYALDQMNPNDPFKTQVLDGGLGVTKGLALKGIFHKLGQAEVGIAAKGVGLGVTSRFAEIGLTRQTYMNPNGEYSAGQGFGRITTGMFSKEALLTDTVVFGLAHGMVRGGNSITSGAIDRSPLATSMLTAGSFGLLSGSNAEVHKQLSEGKSLATMDYAAILKKGAIQGSIDLLAGGPGGLQARAAMRPPITSRSGELSLVATPGKVLESSYLNTDTAPRAPAENIRREGPGVFSGSKPGELWVAERDMTRVPIQMLAREISEVRSPLFAFEPLQGFSREILRVTDSWQGDLATKAQEVQDARERYVDSVKGVKEKILSEDVLRLEEIQESAYAREQLADRPDLLRTYNDYVAAREAHAAKVADLDREVEVRAQQLQETVNGLTDRFDLARIRVKAYQDLGGSGAQYGVGRGELKLRNEDLYNRSDTAGLVSRILHELGHSGQDSLGIRHLADSLGLGKQATPAQLDALQKLYKARTGTEPVRNWLETVLKVRDGRQLNPADAAHAELLLDGFKNYESPTDTLIDTGNHFRMTERMLSTLVDRNGGFHVVEKLQADKSGTLSEHLFGTKKLPPLVEQLVQLKKRFDHFETAEWPELRIRGFLKSLFDRRLAELNAERKEAFTKYMAGLNEREAWLIGARAKVMAERLGGTTGDTKLSPEMQALRDALEGFTIH